MGRNLLANGLEDWLNGVRRVQTYPLLFWIPLKNSEKTGGSMRLPMITQGVIEPAIGLIG